MGDKAAGVGTAREGAATAPDRAGLVLVSLILVAAVANLNLSVAKITAAAKASFLQGDQWAYVAGIDAILIGAALVYFLFPRKRQEEELLAQYHAQDTPRGIAT
jgi:hypothetical protein